MSLPLGTTATVSCYPDEEYSGPTIVLSTGVDHYRISPRIIQILQESFGNDRLCDDELGVRCYDPVGSVIEALENAGFTVTSSSNGNNGRKMWNLTKTS